MVGEAKRRREAEAKTLGDQGVESAEGANYPRKGLVVSVPMEISGTQLRARGQLDTQELRAALLYWDELVWPSSHMIYFASGPDEQFLEQQGILTRPTYSFNGDAAQGMAMTQIMAFKELDAREPGKWALAQGENSFLLRDGPMVNGNSAMIELVKAIPVPNLDVPLAEVLEFKTRRHDELLQLRSEIDSLFNDVNTAENTRDKLAENVQRVDVACADVIRLGGEWQFPMRLTNFKPTYEFRPFATIAGALGPFVGAQGLGLPASQAALAGLVGASTATAPALKLSFDGFQWVGLRPRLGPYRYVYHFHDELF